MAMQRGYWLPDNHKQLLCCAGFYIPAGVIDKTADIVADWDAFEKAVCTALSQKDKTLKRYCSLRTGEVTRYVLTHNSEVDIIAEQFEGPKIQNQAKEEYIAVFAIIPEDCDCPGEAQRSFGHYVNILQDVLCAQYPGHVFERANSVKIIQVDKKKRWRRRKASPSVKKEPMK